MAPLVAVVIAWVIGAVAASVLNVVVGLTFGSRAESMFTAGEIAGALIFVPVALVRARQILRGGR